MCVLSKIVDNFFFLFVMLFLLQVGLTKAGMIQALELDLYSNCGYATDLSMAVSTSAVPINQFH